MTGLFTIKEPITVQKDGLAPSLDAWAPNLGYNGLNRRL